MDGRTMSSGRRALDDEEKREIIERLYQLWTRHPAMRLGQLIGNVYHSNDRGGLHLYYEEDFPLLDSLEIAYGALPSRMEVKNEPAV